MCSSDLKVICDYLFCKAFGKIANNVEKYINQGSLVGITGQMQSRKFEKEGQMHFVSEVFIETIKFMSPRSKNEDEALFDPLPIVPNQELINKFHIEENDIYEIV